MGHKQDRKRRDAACHFAEGVASRRIIKGELSEAVRMLAGVPHVIFLNGHLAQPALIKFLGVEVGLLGESPRVELDLSPRIEGSVSEEDAHLFAPLWRVPENQMYACHSVSMVPGLHEFVVIPIDVPAGMLASFDPVVQGNFHKNPNEHCLEWCIEHFAEVKFAMMRLDEEWPVWKPIVLLSADVALLQSAMEECVRTSQGEVFSAYGVKWHGNDETPRG